MAGNLSQLAERLDEVLAQEDLKPDARAWGRNLRDRLRAPVQVVVAGPRGSGKSAIIDMLSGAPVVPERIHVPVLEIVGGANEGVRVELSDGSTAAVAPGAPLPEGVTRMTRVVSDPLLEDCNFAEIDIGAADPSSIPPALEWALDRADMVLWCSPVFDTAEQAIWHRVPDALKDHSFLILTHADRHLAGGALAARIDALSAVVEEEFLSLFPIATPAAAAAGRDPDRENAREWKSSGGKALYDAVHKRIEHGRLADEDSARLFLSRFARLRQTRAATSRVPTRIPDPTPRADDCAVHATAFRQAQALLQRHADTMMASFGKDDAPDATAILDACVAAADELAGFLSDRGASDAVICALRDDAAESAEMMLLFQLESTEDAAIDAVCLLMQLKRELAEQAAG